MFDYYLKKKLKVAQQCNIHIITYWVHIIYDLDGN